MQVERAEGGGSGQDAPLALPRCHRSVSSGQTAPEPWGSSR